MNGYRLGGVERLALLEHGRWVYGYGMEDALILSPPKPAKAALLELAKAACAVASAVAITFLANLLSNKFERWQPKRTPEPKPEPRPVVPIIIKPPTMRPYGRSHAADVYDAFYAPLQTAYRFRGLTLSPALWYPLK